MQLSSWREFEEVRLNLGALAFLYVLELAALLGCRAFYKKSDRALPDFLVSQVGFIFLFAVVILAISSLFLAQQYRAHSPSKRRERTVTLILNVWSVIILLATTEVTIRTLAVNTPAGPMFGDALLLPRTCESFAARNRAIGVRILFTTIRWAGRLVLAAGKPVGLWTLI